MMKKRAFLLLLLALTSAAFSIEGYAQIAEGYYYIANFAANSSNATTYSATNAGSNYYLVPAANGTASIFYEDAYYPQTQASGHYTETNPGDENKPFLTTYKTNKDDNSLWQIIAVSGETNTYYIKHCSTGKYVIYEPPHSAATNRKSMHLLETTLSSLGNNDNGKFVITTNGDGYNIRPKSLVPDSSNSNNCFFNPANKNLNQYNGQNTGNSSNYYHNGLIGVWKETTGNSIWFFEQVVPQCGAPEIIYNGTSFSFTYPTFPSSGVSIYYTTNGQDPTTSSTLYQGGNVPFSGTITVTAFAVASGCSNSEIVSRTMTYCEINLSGSGTENDPYLIEDADDFDNFLGMAEAVNDGYYKITSSFTVNSGSAVSTPFSGSLDGDLNTVTGLNHPIFQQVNGGTVKDLMLSGVNITTSGNAGAIANVLQGTSTNMGVVYNCGIMSGSVGGSAHVGGLVGDLGVSGNNDNCYARVINCFSYANITNGTEKAGIVGHNYYASKTGNIKTMVMNCMFYGNIDYSSGNVYPIYGGEKISNEDIADVDVGKLNNYNYFRYESDYSKGGHITEYNCALATEERYLVRFEFYRYLLNSTRELASWYVFGSVQADAHDKMHKWVLDKSIAPYPILKVQGIYPSVVNYDPDYTFDATSGQKVSRTSVSERNKGKNLGTLTVNIDLGSGAPTGAVIRSGKSQITLQRTDKDYDNYNFNYDKVQLPYYNEVGTGNCTKNKVVTGWKITGMTGGEQGSFTPDDRWDGYNFADRSHYAKDLYSESGRVFSQGAYFDVPDGVTAINIEPYWGTAVYLADANYDCYGYGTSQGVVDFGTHYSNNTNYNICGDNQQKVYTTFSNALSKLSNSGTVYDNAIVLVGNYHQKGSPSTGDKAFTIMSVDMNEDNEPDYCFIYNSGKGEKIAPVRFDFVNVPATSMAHKQTSTTYMGIMGNHKWKGWLEVTNTCFIRFSQLEYDDKGTKADNSPVILLGGVVEQMVSTNGDNDPLTSTPYIHVGSNAWFKLFNNGCHIDKTAVSTPRVPISVTGGDYEKFYLSGYFQPNAPSNTNDHAECYISGGRFNELAGAGQELIDGNVQWLIDRADITNFYGGGINDNKAITGNITVTIKNSHVGNYYGGPKFGNMASGKTVTTTASDCFFGTFFGAGYGGTSLLRYTPSNQAHNQYNLLNYPWNTWLGDSNGYYRGNYQSDKGIAVSFEYEHFEGSNDKTVGRLYINYASLSLARTNDVTSTLTDCTITNNFYGGGSLGKVAGNTTSTLTNCKVLGNVYGAGLSATPPITTVFDNNEFVTEPNYNANTGIFEPGVFPTSTDYIWSDEGSNSNTLVDDGEDHWIHTDISLDDLGRVTGNVNLTINGNTTVTGSVFGGGEQSAVKKEDGDPDGGNTTVVISERAKVYGNIYGGGNMGEVGGNTQVIINGTVNQ